MTTQLSDDDVLDVVLELDVSITTVRTTMKRGLFNQLRDRLLEVGTVDFDQTGLDYSILINELDVDLEDLYEAPAEAEAE